MEINMEPLLNPAMPEPRPQVRVQIIPPVRVQQIPPPRAQPIVQAANQPIPNNQIAPANKPFLMVIARWIKILAIIVGCWSLFWLVSWILWSKGITLRRQVSHNANDGTDCPYYYISPLFCPVAIQNIQNRLGLILIGDLKDIEKSKKYITGSSLVFNSKYWRTADDNQYRLTQFIKKTDNFRVVILISEEKLQDRKALFLRDLIQELSHFKGIQNHLDYIDILVIDRNFKVTISNNLVSFAKLKQNFPFKKTPHLVSNLLFNLKNHSITEQMFFKDIYGKIGLNSKYLIVDDNQLDITKMMAKQADQILATLPTVLKTRSVKQPQTIVSLYYSVCNNLKDEILSITQRILDQRVVIHMSNKVLERRYKTEIKNQTEYLGLKINMDDSHCTSPYFDRHGCENEFFIKEMKKSQNK